MRSLLNRLVLGIGFNLVFFSLCSMGQSVPVPEFYGIYAVVDGHLLKLDGKVFNPEKKVTVRFGQRNTVGNIVNRQPAALPPKSTLIPVFPADMKLVIFEDSPLDVAQSFHLTPLVFVKNLSVDTGIPDNIRRTDGENGWDDGSPAELLMANMGDSAQELELLVKPMSGQKDIVIAGVAEKLTPGVYRLSREGQALVFAVEPVSQGETARCVNQQLSYMMTLSKTKYTACTGSAAATSPDQSNSAIGGSTPSAGNGGAAACSDYDSCLSAGKKDGVAKDWDGANTAFLVAAKQRPASGEPWVWLGRILLLDGQPHQVGDLAKLWDKALSLGSTIMIGACHERTLQPCERGDLALGKDSVAFLVRGTEQVFSAPPSGIEPGKILNNPAASHITYSLKADGKSYALDFFPPGIRCTVNLMVQCTGDGMEKQLLISQYVAQALPKLASGAYASITRDSAEATGPHAADRSNVNQAASAASTNSEPADTILFGTDTGTIRVKDFDKHAKQIYETGGSLLDKTPKYEINSYPGPMCKANQPWGCFMIDLDKTAVRADQLSAEQSLIKLLGVSLVDYCKLPVVVETVMDSNTTSIVSNRSVVCAHGKPL